VVGDETRHRTLATLAGRQTKGEHRRWSARTSGDAAVSGWRFIVAP
jgi:hypothetical protein